MYMKLSVWKLSLATGPFVTCLVTCCKYFGLRYRYTKIHPLQPCMKFDCVATV